MPEFFKPIHSPALFQKEKQGEEKTDLFKEIEAMKETIASMERELQECLRVKEEMEFLNSKLEEEKNSLLVANKELENLVHDLNLSKKTFENLLQELSNNFLKIEERIKEQVKELAINIAKRLYLTDKLPKEEVVVKAVEKALSNDRLIGGMVRIFLNPKDYPFIEQLITKFELNNVKIELIKKNDINRGDFLMETPNFWIERELDSILKEIEEEL
ncbi:FliH/SctL family protein [Thermocrinis sp.]